MLASCAALHATLPPLQVRPVPLFTRTTLPPVALMLTDPITSGVGSAGALPVLAAIHTRKFLPGGNVALIMVTGVCENSPVPVALAYCTDQFVIVKGLWLRLNSST